MGLRIIVCGGRDYQDADKIRQTLTEIHRGERGPIDWLFHGDARGADKLAAQWGDGTNGVNVQPVPAEWDKYKSMAGPIRNAKMLLQAIDLVVAFPGDKGTNNMKKQARLKGVEVMEVS